MAGRGGAARANRTLPLVHNYALIALFCTTAERAADTRAHLLTPAPCLASPVCPLLLLLLLLLVLSIARRDQIRGHARIDGRSRAQQGGGLNVAPRESPVRGRSHDELEMTLVPWKDQQALTRREDDPHARTRARRTRERERERERDDAGWMTRWQEASKRNEAAPCSTLSLSLSLSPCVTYVAGYPRVAM